MKLSWTLISKNQFLSSSRLRSSKQRRPTPGEVERRLPLHQSLELCKEIGKNLVGSQTATWRPNRSWSSSDAGTRRWRGAYSKASVHRRVWEVDPDDTEQKRRLGWRFQSDEPFLRGDHAELPGQIWRFSARQRNPGRSHQQAEISADVLQGFIGESAEGTGNHAGGWQARILLNQTPRGRACSDRRWNWKSSQSKMMGSL